MCVVWCGVVWCGVVAEQVNEAIAHFSRMEATHPRVPGVDSFLAILTWVTGSKEL